RVALQPSSEIADEHIFFRRVAPFCRKCRCLNPSPVAVHPANHRCRCQLQAPYCRAVYKNAPGRRSLCGTPRSGDAKDPSGTHTDRKKVPIPAGTRRHLKAEFRCAPTKPIWNDPTFLAKDSCGSLDYDLPNISESLRSDELNIEVVVVGRLVAFTMEDLFSC